MRQPSRRPIPRRSELAEALAACRGAFISIGFMSGMSNILMLTGYRPDTQGEAVIFQPDAAGGYTRLVSVMPGDWTRARSVPKR